MKPYQKWLSFGAGIAALIILARSDWEPVSAQLQTLAKAEPKLAVTTPAKPAVRTTAPTPQQQVAVPRSVLAATLPHQDGRASQAVVSGDTRGSTAVEIAKSFKQMPICELREGFWDLSQFRQLHDQYAEAYTAALMPIFDRRVEVYAACDKQADPVDLRDRWYLARELWLLLDAGVDLERYGLYRSGVRAYMALALRDKALAAPRPYSGASVAPLREALTRFGFEFSDLGISPRDASLIQSPPRAHRPTKRRR